MSDLIVSGGGTSAVSTDAMSAAEGALDTAARVLSDAASDVGALLWATSAQRRPHLTIVSQQLSDAHDRATRLSTGLREAARSYGQAEQAVASATQTAGEMGGWLLGSLVPFFAAGAIEALPGLGLLALAGWLGAKLAPDASRTLLSKLGSVVADHQGVLRDPRVVALVRLLVSSTDDIMLGLAGVPLPVARRLDDRDTGLFGVHGAASVVIAGWLGKGLDETNVGVARVRSIPVTGPAVPITTVPPTSFTDLADRVPGGGADGQVRIERYEPADGGRPSWIVYVGGTEDTSFTPGTQPWDDTSNLYGVAGLDSASIRATNEAMVDAGVQAGDTVMPVGYSQGGIVATRIATDGQYIVPTLVTFGSPTGGVDIPSSVTNVAVEHTDDIIPALGGEPRDAAHGGDDRLLVRRRSYDGDLPLEESPLAAHHLTTYEQTTRMMDDSSDPRLIEARQSLAAVTGGANIGGLKRYVGTRVTDAD